MSENQETASRAERLIRGATLWLGVAALAVGTAGSRFAIIERPVVGLIIASVGAAMATAVLLQMLAAQKPPVVLVLLADGEPTQLKPRDWVSPRSRAIMGLLIVVGAFGWHAGWALDTIGGPATWQFVEYDTYPRRYLNNALVESEFNGRLSRYTTYTGQILDEDRRDYGMRFTTAASLQRRNTFYGPTTLDHETFAIEFELRARSEHSPVKIEAIRVILDAYEPLPEYAPPVGGAEVTDVTPFYLYHAVLRRPSEGSNRSVLARSVAAADTQPGEACEHLCLRHARGGSVYVTDEGPTAFLVKVEAPDPGFYGFDVEVLLSAGMETQRFGVASFAHVLFY